MESVEEFIANNEFENLDVYIDMFTNMLIRNMKIRIIDYDIKGECDKFVILLQQKTGKTKQELAKMLYRY